MAATFTEVSLEDMEKFLKRAFRSLHPKQGSSRNEYYYDLKLGPAVDIRVWSSVTVRSGMGAEVGSDAIRIQFLSSKDGRPLEKGKAPIVKRTQGWRTSLQDRVEDLIEKYESNDTFWEDWAETRRREAPKEEVAPPAAPVVEERPPSRPPSGRAPDATFSKMRDGSWGVRVQGTVQAGDTVMVTRKDGRQVPVVIESVVWTGNGITLAKIPQNRNASDSEEPSATYDRSVLRVAGKSNPHVYYSKYHGEEAVEGWAIGFDHPRKADYTWVEPGRFYSNFGGGVGLSKMRDPVVFKTEGEAKKAVIEKVIPWMRDEGWLDMARGWPL